MIKKIGILALVATLVASMTVASALACELPGLSPGYWKHNVKVYCGGPGSYSGDPHETKATMEGYETYIQNNIYGPFTLELANEIFQGKANDVILLGYKNKDLWLTLANAFNEAAGRLPYSD